MTKTVYCDGTSAEEHQGHEHPGIYLSFKETADCVSCPYCGRVFEKEANTKNDYAKN